MAGHQLLLDEHDEVFAVDEGEQGDTDLVKMSIDTGDESPRKQPLRHTPDQGLADGCITPCDCISRSCLATSCLAASSPVHVVLVRKRDDFVSTIANSMR